MNEMTSSIIYSVLVFAVVFQNPLTNYIPIMGYYDEILSLVIFMMGCIYKIRYDRGIDKKNCCIIICLFIMLAEGWLSYMVYHYQSFSDTLLGGYLQIKFLLMLIGMEWLAGSERMAKKIISHHSTACFAVMWILVILEVCSKTIKGVSILRAWDMCSKGVFLVVGVVATSKKESRDIIAIIIGGILLLSTHKAKGVGGIAFIVLLYTMCVYKKKKIHVYHLSLLVMIIIPLVWKKIYSYYIFGMINGWARAVMTITGFRVANDYFPFGTGFGAFASYIAAKAYSPVYYLYDIATHSEMGAGREMYLMDTYWPSVMGEMGWIGCLSVIIVLLLVFLLIQSLYNYNKRMYASALISFLYVIVTTIEETGLMQPVVMCQAITIGICIAYIRKDIDK